MSVFGPMLRRDRINGKANENKYLVRYFAAEWMEVDDGVLVFLCNIEYIGILYRWVYT